MRMVRTGIAAGLVLAVGCGGGGGGGHGSDVVATPVRTPTPTVTPATRVSLALTVSSAAAIAGASFDVGYQAGRGSFAGSGAQAQCRLASGDVLAVNDDDAGMLHVAVLPADPRASASLALPTTLTCDFDETSGTTNADDLRVTNKKVGVLNASGVVVAGDPSVLDVPARPEAP